MTQTDEPDLVAAATRLENQMRIRYNLAAAYTNLDYLQDPPSVPDVTDGDFLGRAAEHCEAVLRLADESDDGFGARMRIAAAILLAGVQSRRGPTLTSPWWVGQVSLTGSPGEALREMVPRFLAGDRRTVPSTARNPQGAPRGGFSLARHDSDTSVGPNHRDLAMAAERDRANLGPRSAYNLACYWTDQGEYQRALVDLAEAVVDPKILALLDTDPSLHAVRSNKDYKERFAALRSRDRATSPKTSSTRGKPASADGSPSSEVNDKAMAESGASQPPLSNPETKKEPGLQERWAFGILTEDSAIDIAQNKRFSAGLMQLAGDAPEGEKTARTGGADTQLKLVGSAHGWLYPTRIGGADDSAVMPPRLDLFVLDDGTEQRQLVATITTHGALLDEDLTLSVGPGPKARFRETPLSQGARLTATLASPFTEIARIEISSEILEIQPPWSIAPGHKGEPISRPDAEAD